jgi:hypothetical protein
LVIHVYGKPLLVNVRGPVSADGTGMLLRLAIEVVGIVRFGEIAVARALRDGLLKPLLRDFQEDAICPSWAVLPPGRQRAPR